MIPNIIHFIFGLKKDFGGINFSFIHFLSVVTAFNVNKPEKIYFHYRYEPSGYWWEKAKPYLTLKRIDPPEMIFGNKIKHAAHKADVVRLQTLISDGGIYLDMDVICINPLKPLLNEKCVLGIEPGLGLCNAVILAEKDAKFLKIWHQNYRYFNETVWNYHSVELPLHLAQENPSLITIKGKYAFFYPMYNDPEHVLWKKNIKPQKILKKIYTTATKNIKKKGRNNYSSPLKHYILGQNWHFKKLKKSYCIHLWESLW